MPDGAFFAISVIFWAEPIFVAVKRWDFIWSA
jgi:hypothetical protein